MAASAARCSERKTTEVVATVEVREWQASSRSMWQRSGKTTEVVSLRRSSSGGSSRLDYQSLVD